MKEKMSIFQLGVLAFFILSGIIGVIIFSIQRSSNQSSVTDITMWGTLPLEFINNWIDEVNGPTGTFINIEYTEFREEEFEDVILNALAEGRGPDTFIMTEDLIINHKNKLYKINYEFYDRASFQTNFIEGSEILLDNDGLIGFPIIIDPLVLYWNRTILNNYGIRQPPAYWDEFLELTPKITQKDPTSNIILKPAVAMGEYENIKNAKEILITLINQAGGSVLQKNNDNSFSPSLNDDFGFTNKPSNTALNFYTQFSNPNLEIYSWNRGMGNSFEIFLANDMAFYFGFSRERQSIISRNPNLNFEVATVPQSRSSNSKDTVAKLYFVAISNNSKNISNAFTNLTNLSSQRSISVLADITDAPSVRRDVSQSDSDSVYKKIFNESALFSKIFVDPSKQETDKIFKDMIESVVSGDKRVTEAISRAEDEMFVILD